jgi:hypothetical protein
MASWNEEEEEDVGSGGETDGNLDDYEQAVTASTSAIQHIQRASSSSP